MVTNELNIVFAGWLPWIPHRGRANDVNFTSVWIVKKCSHIVSDSSNPIVKSTFPNWSFPSLLNIAKATPIKNSEKYLVNN